MPLKFSLRIPSGPPTVLFIIVFYYSLRSYNTRWIVMVNLCNMHGMINFVKVLLKIRMCKDKRIV